MPFRLPASAPRHRRPHDLAYASDERPPGGALLGLATQHAGTALALIAYALATAHIAGLSVVQTNGLVTATVLGMALSTFLQAWGGSLGAGALIVHIPSPTFITLSATALALHGPGGLVFVGLIRGLTGLLIGQAAPRLRKLLPPAVAGVVVCLAGLSLIAPALHHTTGIQAGGGFDSGSLLISGTALTVIMLLSVWGSRRARILALMIGLMASVALAAAMGRLESVQALAAVPFFGLPSLVAPTLDMSPGLLAGTVLLAAMTQIDMLSAVVLMGRMDDAGWRRPDLRQVGGSMRAGALGTLLAAVLGGCSNGASSANIALSHISRSTSRYIGLATALLLALVAFLPQFTLALTLIPTPVIGAVEIYAATYLTVSGIELIASRAMDARGTFMVGLAFVAGVGVMLLPDLAGLAPESLRFLASNGMIVGGLVAIVLNLLFRLGASQRAARALPASGKEQMLAIEDFVETQGQAWGVRREVLRRAADAVQEAASAIAAVGAGHALAIHGRFDEFNLEIELGHDGDPLCLDGHAPLEANLLDHDGDAFDAAMNRAMTGVSVTLLRHLADRLSAGRRNGQAYLRLHFDH
jgi:xanthine/uracil permease